MSRKDILLKIISTLKQLILLHQTLLIKKLKKRKGSAKAMSQMIRLIAQQEGVDPDLAVRVAQCESRLNPDAIRWNPGYGYDRGLYQWNEYWHPEVSIKQAFDPESATRLFCRAVKSGHLDWWNASRHCWNK